MKKFLASLLIFANIHSVFGRSVNEINEELKIKFSYAEKITPKMIIPLNETDTLTYLETDDSHYSIYISNSDISHGDNYKIIYFDFYKNEKNTISKYLIKPEEVDALLGDFEFNEIYFGRAALQYRHCNAKHSSDYFACSGLKFSKLDSKLLDSDLKDLDKAQLQLMRNAVYSRHGRTFKSVDLQSLWECHAWYEKNSDYSESLLTDIDKYNIELIKSHEN